MKKTIISVMMAVLIVMIPVCVSAQMAGVYYGDSAIGSAGSIGSSAVGIADSSYRWMDSVYDDIYSLFSDEQDLGEVIIVNVEDYEPKLLRESLLEQQESPIFVYLKGTTLGTMLESVSRDISAKDPLSGVTEIPPIKDMKVIPINKSAEYIESIKYIAPSKNAYSLDNLGYLMIYIKKKDPKTDYPDVLDLSLQAKIIFDMSEGGLFGLSSQDLVVNLDQDQNQFFEKVGKSNNYQSFLSNRGYVRMTDTGSGSATFVVYDKGLSVLSLLSPASSSSAGLASPNVQRLSVGGYSPLLNLQESGDPLRDTFRIRLNAIKDATDTASVKINIGGKSYVKVLTVGSHLFEGSRWIVQEISSNKRDITASGEGLKAVMDELNNDFGVVLSEDQLVDLHIEEQKIKITNPVSSDTRIITRKVLKKGDGNYNVPVDTLTDSAAGMVENRYCGGEESSQEAGCRAMLQFRKLVNTHETGGDAEKAYENLAFLTGRYMIPYETCTGNPDGKDCLIYTSDMNRLTLYYYNKIKELNPNRAAEVDAMKNDVGNQRAPPYFLADEQVSVSLMDVELRKDSDRGFAEMSIGDSASRKYNINEDLRDGSGNSLRTYDEKSGKWYSWRVVGLEGNRVIVSKTDDAGRAFGSSVYLGVSEEVRLELVDSKLEVSSVKIKITNVQSRQQALITIIPGYGRGVSRSNFNVHIPIDKRLFKFTPEQLESQIETWKKVIEDLDKVVNKLDSVVRYWKRTCLITFGVLTLKNTIFGGAENVVRKDVAKYFREKCRNEMDMDPAKYGTSIEKCYSEHSSEISTAVKQAASCVDDVNKLTKGKSYDELRTDSEDFKKYSAGGGSMVQFRNYEMSKCAIEKVSDSGYKEYLKKQEDNVRSDKMLGNYDKAVAVMKSKYNDGLNLNDKKQQEELKIIVESMSEGEKDANSVNLRHVFISGDKATAYITDSAGNIVPKEIRKITVLQKGFVEWAERSQDKTFEKYVGAMKSKECGSKTNNERTACENGIVNRLENYNTDAISNNGNYYIESKDISEKEESYGGKTFKLLSAGGNLLTSKPQYFTSSVAEYGNTGRMTSKAYHMFGSNIIKAQYAKDGSPYCYPVGNGEYVKVLSWFKIGKPNDIEEFNVGADGVIDCGLAGSDDVMTTHVSLMNHPASIQKKANLLRKIEEAQRCREEGQSVGQVDGVDVVCSFNQAEIEEANYRPECIDTMDPAECRILFNACDPVMCPSSRCNLGGRYPNQDVIRSGIIGSTMLCVPNFPNVVVPFCLTGILAGLKNIRSIMQGYVDCLDTNLKSGEFVGVCDYITAVGYCELIWREAITVFKIRGGILSSLIGKVFGERGGGAEYLTFQESMSNMEKSFSAFTSDYSNTYIAAYKGKSTEEIGTQICRLQAAGKIPSIGDFIDQLSEPEDPPQFTAWFDSAPYVEGAGYTPGVIGAGLGTQELTIYKVFYHIYAGSGIPTEQTLIGSSAPVEEIYNAITYSVYLKNPTNGNILYVTTNPKEYGARQATISRGSYAQKTIQTVAPSGYDEICVVINGRNECGFKKVTTGLGLKIASDAIIGDEALKMNVQSADECVPSGSQLSPTLGSLATPEEYGLLSTGISRVCSVAAPTGGEGKWKPVGTCGKDNNGIDLGMCWVDTESVNIEDVKKREDVMDALNKQGYDATEAEKSIKRSVAVSILGQLNEIRNNIIKKLVMDFQSYKVKKSE